MQNEKSYIRLPLWKKLAYGVGDFGANYCWSFIAGFILIYCTNTLGISAAVIGTIMMLSKILDGISDVIMGQVIDRTKCRFGKARFWMLVSALPVGISTFLLFTVPASFTENTKYAYIYIMYTLMGAVFYTMNNIAYSTLSALATKNNKERVEMGSYRFVFAITAMLIINSTTMPMVEAFGGGQKGWTVVALIYSVICVVCLLVPVLCIKELSQEELEETKIQSVGTEEKKLGFWKSFSYLLHNKFFIIILFLYLVDYLMNGITGGVGVYYATYILGDAALLGILSMARLLPKIVLLPFVPKLTEKIGMRTASMLGCILSLGGAVLAYFGRTSFVIVCIGMVIESIGWAPKTGSLNALIAATDDYSYLKHGHRMTGTMFSCSSMGMKVGTGLGTALCGWLLTFGGFDGMAKIQTEQAIATIGNMYILPVVFGMIVTVALFYFLNVEKVNKELRMQKEADK